MTIDRVSLQREFRSFKAFTSPLNELKEWLLSNYIIHVEKGNADIYWKPVYKNNVKSMNHSKLSTRFVELLDIGTEFVEEQ